MKHTAEIATIVGNAGTIVAGVKLMRNAETPEEKTAARALRRVMIGSIVLTLVLVLALSVAMVFCMTPLELENGRSCVGIVQMDGQVRYTDNVHRFLSQAELEMEDYGLQPGDKVTIYFDPVTDEPTSGYPYAIFEQHTNTRIGIMLGAMALMVVIILVYAIVICRYTSFGSAWYLYMKKLRKKTDKEIPLRAKIVIYAVAFAIAIAVCWPSIQSITENITKGKELREMIQSGQAAADSAVGVLDALETVGQNSGAEDAISDAENAASAIGDILDSLNGGK